MAVAVVTGAAGAIGRSISTRLAKDGYAIALLDASPRVEEVYEEFKAADLPACSVQCNITEPEQVRQAYATVCDTLGRPSLLVNNAGIYELCPTAELSWERWKATIDTNLGGAFLCSQAFGVGMLEAGGGVIVNIASGRAFGCPPKARPEAMLTMTPPPASSMPTPKAWLHRKAPPRLVSIVAFHRSQDSSAVGQSS